MSKELLMSTYERDTLLYKETLLGILKNNYLSYADEQNTFLIDLKSQNFRKENLESILEITSQKALITLKEINKTFELNLKKYIFQIKNNKIIIEYLLESNENPIKIEIEMSDINA